MSTSTRPVISPLAPPKSPIQSQQASEILRRRLATAEEDTRRIIEQLGSLVESEQPLTLPRDQLDHAGDKDKHFQLNSGSLSAEKLLPLKGQMAEPLPNSFSPDVLISRVCRLESALYTLKEGLVGNNTSSSGSSFQGVSAKGGKRKLKVEFDERVSQIREELGTELMRLQRQVSSLQEELTTESDARQRIKEENGRLKEALEQAVHAKVEASVSLEELTSTRQKLLRRINELKEEAAREASLRGSLETSHSTLLIRIQEMESVIEKERKEVQSVTNDIVSLKQEIVHLKEDLKEETTRRQMAEESCQQLIAEKEKSHAVYETMQSECKMASTELSRLQGQYTSLIKHLEETKITIDQQKAEMRRVEGERDRLVTIEKEALVSQQTMEKLQKLLTQSESNHVAIKTALEEELVKHKMQATDLSVENLSLKNTVKHLQAELESSQLALVSKEADFSSTTARLETELCSVRQHLQSMESEKESVLRDKESLLEEVNQTVDSLMAECNRLKAEVERYQRELESMCGNCHKLEADNAQLLERIGSFEHQQMTHQKVELTLKDMLEQKNKLAYENGKLNSQIDQLRQDFAEVTAQSKDAMQLRKSNDVLQAKIIKMQKEIDESKMAAQRLEGRLHHAEDLLEQKQHTLVLTQGQREELERELGKLLTQVEVLEGREKHKNQLHQKNMSDAKSVNREISNTLEAVMTSHTQLQELVESLQGELGRRDMELGRLKNLRIKEQNEMKLEINRFEEIVETLRAELKKEHEVSGRKMNRDLAELKKQSSNMSTRNGELAATNAELRQRVGEMERTIAELQQKILAQRHKVEHMHKAKKQVEDNLKQMKQMREDIDELEQLRDEYMLKNKEQAETISAFMTQMVVLQDEVRQLAAAQVNTGQLLHLKEKALEKERKLREEMKKKYSETRNREQEMSKQTHITEEKLKEVHDESLEISKHLLEAHEWFKGKFDKLQEELADSRAVQSKLEQENKDQKQQLQTEKSRAEIAAQRAKEMIKASRESISRLADYTEQADSETKQQLAQLRAEMQREKLNSRNSYLKTSQNREER